MMSDGTVLTGVVHGRTIEFPHDIGLPDGQPVSVTVQTLSSPDAVPADALPADTLPPGEGLRRAFGSLAEDADDLDAYLAWTREQRKVSRRELEP